MVDADIHDEKEVADTNDKARMDASKTCNIPKACDKDCKNKTKNKDSSDEECACKPTPLSVQDKARVIQIQGKRKAEALVAKQKADELRKKAEEAINAANEARAAAVQKSMELTVKAQEATEIAET